MAITIDWGNTYVISVPKADMTLIQSTPVEIRELDANWFRLQLKDLEDSEDGMPFDDTHTHNTEVTLGGLTFARVIEILDPYSVTFEDGQYVVDITGGNTNILDKTNANQVSVRANNSAGLISNPDIEYASFNGGVAIDASSGYTGTVFPRGTERMKVDNISDALLIAEYRGFNKIYFFSDYTLGVDADMDDFFIEGQSHVSIDIAVGGAANVANCVISEASISGTLDGGNSITNCIIGDLTYVNGHIHGSALKGTITLGGSSDAFIVDCSQEDFNTNPTINMGGTGQDCVVVGYTGILEIENLTGGNAIGIGLDAGQVILNSATVTNGTVHVSGIGKLIDENGDDILSGTWNTNVTIINELINRRVITEAVQIADTVYVDSVGGSAGTSFPLGTRRSPVDNLSDALTIAQRENVYNLDITNAITLDTNVSGYSFYSREPDTTITLNNQNIDTCSFTNLTLTGACNGEIHLFDCIVSNVTNLEGTSENTQFSGTCTVAAGSQFSGDRWTSSDITGVIFGMNGTASLYMVNGGGVITITSMTSPTSAFAISGNYVATVHSTVTAGTVFAGGIGILDDQSTSLTSKVDRTLPASVWSEDISSSSNGTVGEGIMSLLGLTGQNVGWSNITHNADSLMTGARITVYEDNTLSTSVKSWDITATYNASRELSTYQMVEV